MAREITEKSLRWDSYDGWAGFWYPGDFKLENPGPKGNPDAKRFFVACSTEGAASDSLNLYDRCGLSGGRYQVTELCSGWLVSRMLGEIMDGAPDLMAGINKALKVRGYEFKKAPTRFGPYAFCDKDGPVSRSYATSRRFFSADSDGRLGSWNRDSESAKAIVPFLLEYLKLWDSKVARDIQDRFLLSRMYSFVPAEGRKFLNLPPVTPWLEAAQAAYLSFSLNNPSIALGVLRKCLGATTCKPGDEAWTKLYLKHAIYDPMILIYPARYGTQANKGHGIRIHLEVLYGIDLPDYADELAKFQDEFTNGTVREIYTVKDIQQALIDLGYNLGPRGADGIMGEKTKAAIRDFQAKAGIAVDGVVGPRTAAELQKALGKLGLPGYRGRCSGGSRTRLLHRCCGVPRDA